MRIIVCPHDMGMGGSQINALDLAAAMRNRGHEVLLYAPSGPLADMATQRGLTMRESETGLRLSAAWSWGLMREARLFNADIVHTYEWAPTIGAAFGTHMLSGIPQIMTILSMDVPHFLPRHLDLVVGTQELESASTSYRRRHVLEPPIDTAFDIPGDHGWARACLGIDANDFVVSIVGRVTTDLEKSSGILAAIRAVDTLDCAGAVDGIHPTKRQRVRCTLIIAGEGPEMDRVRRHADEVNNRRGRQVVRCVGHLADPRPAYCAADVVIGMGSSILRGMAAGRPSIVLGSGGFCLPVEEGNLPHFLWEGFFGRGQINSANTPYSGLVPALERLKDAPDERRQLGAWSRELVIDRFSLGRATEVLEGIYLKRSSEQPSIYPSWAAGFCGGWPSPRPWATGKRFAARLLGDRLHPLPRRRPNLYVPRLRRRHDSFDLVSDHRCTFNDVGDRFSDHPVLQLRALFA